jgi:hypothetical protein
MYLERFFEWIFVDLRRFDLCEVVFDVDEVSVGNDRDSEFLVVFKEGVAKERCGNVPGCCELHKI